MNEKPTIEVGKVPIITKFIYTLGVLPTSYLMTMTYEEQLTWLCNYISQTLIPAINNDVEAIQELQQLYIDLENYVNNYFDNLDVQEEIDNKLDKMIENGTFQQIISQYIMPYFNEFTEEINSDIINQNQRIDVIDTKVDSAVSGSPLVANSIGGMTDTSRIYVLTTTGHWYWYDGDSWEDGGVYQSAEDSTTVNDNKDKINEIYANDLMLEQGGIDTYNGAISNVTTRLYTVNYLEGTHKIILPTGFKIVAVFYYDTDNTFVNAQTINNITTTVTPSNNYKYRISIKKDDGTAAIYPYELDRTSNNKKIYKNHTLNLLQLLHFESGSFNSSGQEVNTQIRVRSDKIYGSHIIVLPDNLKCYNICYFNKSTNEFDHLTVIQRTVFEIVEDPDCYARITISFTNEANITPNDVKYLNNVSENNYNKLYEKSILNFGDSIAAGDGNNGIGYAEIIANSNNMTCNDKAQSGATMSNIGLSHSRECIYNIIHNEVTNSTSDYDFILLEGGCNDMVYNDQSLGSILSTYDTSNADLSTFSGALEKSISELKNKWPLSNYIYIIVHKMTSRDETLQNQYHQRIIEICEKWAIPYVDIYNSGQITSYIQSIATTCFPENQSSPTGYDRTHPNQLGYTKFYCPNIKSKMENLIN